MCLSAFFIYCRILRSEIRKGGLGLQTVSASEILIETRFVCQGFQPGRLLKKLHMLRYARPTRFNLLKRTPQLIELRVPRLWIQWFRCCAGGSTIVLRKWRDEFT
jgi:hypothetical protein